MSEKKMRSESQERSSLDPVTRLHITLSVFTASLLASTLVVVHNNSTRTLAIHILTIPGCRDDANHGVGPRHTGRYAFDLCLDCHQTTFGHLGGDQAFG